MAFTGWGCSHHGPTPGGGWLTLASSCEALTETPRVPYGTRPTPLSSLGEKSRCQGLRIIVHHQNGHNGGRAHSLAELHQAYGFCSHRSFRLECRCLSPTHQLHATSLLRPPTGLQLSLSDGNDECNYLTLYDHHLLSLLRLK